MTRLSPFCKQAFSIALLLALALPYRVEAQDEFVHVRLLRDAGPRTIVVSSTNPINLYSVGIENPISQIPANEKLTLTTSNDRVYLTSSDAGLYASNLVLAQTNNGELTIEIPEGDKRVAPRTYRGAFQIDVEQGPTNKLRIVNAVPLEDYVVSVLSSEFGFSELEGAKAMAVCIRTLALKSLTYQNEPNFAVSDDESWQVYQGTGSITPTAIEATQETLGQVLVHEERLIDAVYFASSGGMTANNEDVWNSSQSEPYLRGKDDAYDSGSPHNTWTSRIDRAQLLSYLSGLYSKQVSGISAQTINRRDGRIKTMQLDTADNQPILISGSEFRDKVTKRFGRESLKSTLFTLEEQSGNYVFEGRGFGHGVGLNQWGARELSRRGQLYDEILDFYYTDVDIQFFEMLGRQNFTYAEKVEADPITNDIPVIDWDTPSNTTTSQVDASTFDTPSASSLPPSTGGIEENAEFEQVEPASDRRSIRSRLFSSDAEYTPEAGSERQRSSAQGESKKKRIQSDAKIVGWSKTVDPKASTASDSLKTQTKRRRGW